jgi:hypothetical protein
MRSFVRLLLATLAAGCGAPPDASTPSIAGPLEDETTLPIGDATNPGLTSAVALVRDGRTICTGTLVAADLVLTAAHCLRESTEPARYLVRFVRERGGSDDLAVATLDVPRRTAAGGVDARLFPFGDVAWLRLAQPAPRSFRPVALVEDPDADLTPGLPLALVGFGTTGMARPDAGVRRTGIAEVGRYHRFGRFAGTIKVVSDDGTGSCRGDSGGPAYAYVDGTWRLAGLTHGVNGFETPEILRHPADPCASGASIYNAVADYLPWIEQSSGVVLGRAGPRPARQPRPDARRTLGGFCRDEAITAEEAYALHSVMLAVAEFDCERLGDAVRAARVLDLGAARLADLTVFQYLPELSRLTLRGEGIQDLGPLRGAVGLERLTLEGHTATDVTPLARLARLSELDLVRGAPLAEADEETLLDGLARLTSLRRLVLRELGLRRLPRLEQLTALRELDVVGNRLQELGPLAGAPQLEVLYASRNAIEDLAPVAMAAGLRKLFISSNRVTSVAPLSALHGLQQLVALANPIPPAARRCPVAEESPGEICQFDFDPLRDGGGVGGEEQ